MIKLIAMDFDWTLVNHTEGAEKISKEVMEELNSFIHKGNFAGIVSGRVFWDFQREFEMMQMPWGKPFPNYVIGREAYIYKVDGNEYTGISEYNEPIREKIINLNKKICMYINDIFNMYEKTGVKIANFFVYGDFALEIHVDSEYAQRAMELMCSFVKENKIEDAAVHRNGIMITVYHKDAGKGNTLSACAKTFGIKPSEVLAIGDNYNDISMIDGKMGFIGACVGNADDNIKDIVKNGGGYVGKGMAHKGIIDILQQVRKDGLLD